MFLSEPKTSSSNRTIVISEEIASLLTAYQYDQGKIKESTKERWIENDLIFPSSIGTIKDKSNLYKDFHRITKAAKLPKIRFHDLRHTAATLMITKGVPINVVSKILGHANPSVTLSIYTHCLTYMQEDAANVMAKITIPIGIESNPKYLSQNYTRITHEM